MLFWIFVIAVGSALGVFLGGGVLLWLHKHDSTVFDALKVVLWFVAVAALLAFAWLRFFG